MTITARTEEILESEGFCALECMSDAIMYLYGGDDWESAEYDLLLRAYMAQAEKIGLRLGVGGTVFAAYLRNQLLVSGITTREAAQVFIENC